MDHSVAEGEQRFAACVEALIGVIGHADRAEPLRDYCTGLLPPEAWREAWRRARGAP